VEFLLLLMFGTIQESTAMPDEVADAAPSAVLVKGI